MNPLSIRILEVYGSWSSTFCLDFAGNGASPSSQLFILADTIFRGSVYGRPKAKFAGGQQCNFSFERQFIEAFHILLHSSRNSSPDSPTPIPYFRHWTRHIFIHCSNAWDILDMATLTLCLKMSFVIRRKLFWEWVREPNPRPRQLVAINLHKRQQATKSVVRRIVVRYPNGENNDESEGEEGWPSPPSDAATFYPQDREF